MGNGGRSKPGDGSTSGGICNLVISVHSADSSKFLTTEDTEDTQRNTVKNLFRSSSVKRCVLCGSSSLALPNQSQQVTFVTCRW